MRRSVRDAIVGFTVLGGLVGFAATGMWMHVIRLGSSEWKLTANFNDASRLTAMGIPFRLNPRLVRRSDRYSQSAELLRFIEVMEEALGREAI